MAWSWPNLARNRTSPIAIDFGSQWLKLLQIVPGNPPQFVAAATAQVPDEARRDAGERWRFLAVTLRDLLKRQPFKGRRAICSLPAHQTLVQNFELNRAEGLGLETPALVAEQLRRRLSVDPTRMVIRHYDLGPIARNGNTHQHVLCIAASRETVMQHIELCGQSKLDVVGMHSEPAAILQAFGPRRTTGGDEDAAAVCYIDLGASTTKLAIMHGSAIVLAKTIHAEVSRLAPEPAHAAAAPVHAGADADEVASTVNAMTFGSAHGDEGETGLAMLNAATGGGPSQAKASTPPTPSTTSTISTTSADTSVDDTLECLIEELQMCLRYHQGLFPNRAVERLVFIGGAARHVQACQRIARAVRVAAQLGDPLAQLSRLGAVRPALGVDLDQPQPGWAVPFGLTHCDANL